MSYVHLFCNIFGYQLWKLLSLLHPNGNLEFIKNSDWRQDKTGKQMGLQNVLHVDVAIKSYAISILTGSTFDGFIDCTNDNI